MQREVSSAPTLAVVLAALVVLTLLTVGVSFFPLAGGWHIAAGLSIAAIKAALVVLFFMEAIHSPRLTWAVIAAAACGLSLLVALTLTDYISRGLVPGMPGH